MFTARYGLSLQMKQSVLRPLKVKLTHSRVVEELNKNIKHEVNNTDGGKES
jgi:hypothetical protein